MRSARLVLAMLGLICSTLVVGCSQRDSQVTPLPTAAQGVPGRFDGTWQIASAAISLDPSSDMPDRGCGAFEVKFDVKDSVVSGGLKRTPYGNTVVSSSGFKSDPMSGTVQPDGTVNIAWEGYVVTGKITGDAVQLQWRGECGPRVATGGRLAGEGAGSTGGTR